MPNDIMKIVLEFSFVDQFYKQVQKMWIAIILE